MRAAPPVAGRTRTPYRGPLVAAGGPGRSVVTAVGNRKAWLSVLIAAAVLWTAMCLRYSASAGRLAQPPLYDDVAYLMDGARRASRLDSGGVRRLAADLRERAPKSPYSTIVATAAFLLLGPVTWGPYLSNVLVVLALVYAAARAARGVGLPTWAACGLALLALRLPMAARAASEFRPDLLSGLLAAIGVLAALGPRRAGSFAVGMWFGAAIFVKPTAAPAVGVLWAASAGAGLWIAARERPGPGRVRWWVEGMLVGLAGLAVLPAIYAPIGAGFTWTYLKFNLWGPGLRLWVQEMTLGEELAYYVTGRGGVFMFGSLGPVLVGLALLDFALGALRRERAERWRGAACLGVLALSYAVAVATPIKNVFFGAQFHALLVVLAARGLARLLMLWPRGGGVPAGWGVMLRGGALGALALAALWTFRMPGRFPAADPYWRAEVSGLYDDIYNAVRERLPRDRHGYLFLTYTGFINSANLQYRAEQDRLRLTVRSAEMQDRPEKYAPWIKQADLVLALPEGTSHDIGRFPSVKMLDASLAYLESRADLVRVATFPVRDSRRRDEPGRRPPEYVLFAKREPFEGWTAVTGMSLRRAINDPNVPGGVYRGRWGGTILAVESEGGGAATLRLSCRTVARDPVTMTASVNGAAVGRLEVAGRTRWYDLAVPITLARGRTEVWLAFEGSGDNIPVEFRLLRVETPGEQPNAW